MEMNLKKSVTKPASALSQGMAQAGNHLIKMGKHMAPMGYGTGMIFGIPMMLAGGALQAGGNAVKYMTKASEKILTIKHEEIQGKESEIQPDKDTKAEKTIRDSSLIEKQLRGEDRAKGNNQKQDTTTEVRTETTLQIMVNKRLLSFMQQKTR